MLERTRLLVRDADGDRLRSIEDAATGALLGSARPAVGRSRWLPIRSVLEVREAEDAPLVFTVRRALSLVTRYEVRDAEGRPVGWLAGSVASDRGGRRVAVLGPDGTFRDRDGSELARITRARAGIEISFAEAIAVDPFGKMLLLAAVLQR